MAKSPTENSLSRLRKEGYHAAVVEKWNPHAKIRQDLFGFIDVVGLNPEHVGMLAVQTTSKNNIRARINKILDEKEKIAIDWLKAQNTIEVHGWDKHNNRYRLTVCELFLDHGALVAGELFTR